MMPLCAAHVQDLGPDDFVRVECMACGHDEMIPKVGLTQGLRLPLQAALTVEEDNHHEAS